MRGAATTGSEWTTAPETCRISLPVERLKFPISAKPTGTNKAPERLDRLSESFSARHGPRNPADPAQQQQLVRPGQPDDPCWATLSGSWGSISYSRKLAHYDGGKSGRWQLTGSVDRVEGLTNNFLLQDTRSAEEVLWGSLLSASYRFRPEQRNRRLLHLQPQRRGCRPLPQRLFSARPARRRGVRDPGAALRRA